MDDKLNNSNEKRINEIDLKDFDLTDFKEYFEQEDNERKEEERKRAEKEAKEKAEREAAEEKKRAEEIKKQLAIEKKQKEELEAKRRAEFEAREKEEARRAAEKAAEAAMAAKRADEARQKANAQTSAKLRAQAGADNTVLPNEQDPQTESKIEFKQFSSILDIENTSSPDFSDNNNSSDEDIVSFIDKDKIKSIILTVVCVILGVAFVACLVAAIFNFFDKEEQSNESTNSVDTVSVDYKPFSGLKSAYKSASFPDNISEDMKAMYSQNDDLVGWLTIDGTAIDYPIVQRENNTYYLNNHNAFNKSSRYGNPFLDFRCNKFGLSKNTVVYGHRMINDTHFGSLDNFAKADFYKKHPLIKYQTLDKTYTFKIYAVFYATTQASVDGGYVFDYYNPNMSTSSFNGYIQMLNQYALYTTSVGLKADDKIITLSTCSHFYDSLKKGGVDARFVVVGRLLRQGENESVDTDKVTINSDYRKPQLWYDKKGVANPYAAYRSWSPSK